MFRLLIVVLMGLLGSLQFKLWLTQDGYPGIHQLEQQLATQTTENAELQLRNDKLASEIKDLKQGLEAVEERARLDMGMIKQGEQFYHIIEVDQVPATQVSPAASHRANAAGEP